MTTEINSYEQQAIDFLQSTNTRIDFEFKEFGSMVWDENGEERNIFKVTLSNDKHSYSFDFGSSISASTVIIEKPQHEVAKIIDVYAGLRFTAKGISVGKSFKVTKENDFSLPYEDVEKMALEMQTDYFKRANKTNEVWIKKFESGNISRKEMQAKISDANTTIGAFIQCINKGIKREVDKLVPVNIKSNQIVTPSAYDVLACLTKYEPGTFDNFCSDFGYDSDSRKAYKTYKAVMKEWGNISRLFNPEELELLQDIN